MKKDDYQAPTLEEAICEPPPRELSEWEEEQIRQSLAYKGYNTMNISAMQANIANGGSVVNAIQNNYVRR